MNRILAVVCLLIAVSLFGDDLKVMSFNIRYDNPGDGELSWKNRKEKVVSTISFFGPHVGGLQEVLSNQLDDLKKALPEYEFYGVGRIDGREKGEYAPVIYKKDLFDAVKASYFWLSETPSVPGSKSWNTACERMAVWALLKNKKTGKKVLVVNTHLDHVSELARSQGVKLIIEKLGEIMNGNEFPIVMTGDFNGYEKDEFYRVLINEKFKDSRKECLSPIFGGGCSFNGFKPDKHCSGDNNLIDYVFLKNVNEVKKYGLIGERWNGSPSSDHYPVVVEIDLR